MLDEANTMTVSTLNWQELAWIGAALMAAATPIVWVWRDCRAQIDVLHERVSACGKEISAHKLEAARTFVTADAMLRIEGRIVVSEARTTDAVNQLTDRLDRVLEGMSTPPRRART